MTKTFNLSEKIQTGSWCDFLSTNNVKEFIKLMQDELCTCDTTLPQDKCSFCIAKDKLAGESLTGFPQEKP